MAETPGAGGVEGAAADRLGIDLRIAEILGIGRRGGGVASVGIPQPRADERVPFVEPKVPDWHRLAEICALSATAGRWANFGPVAEGLGAVLDELAALPPTHRAVPASSATTALHALVGAHALGSGRPLIWAACAFGFHSSVIGPLAGRVRLIDCDAAGMLDLAHLAALERDAWGGLIVTNLFGLAEDLGGYARLCRAQGKPMIVDSALGFPLPRHHGLGADEIVSFHHTKPWGFGEGGCAIVAEERAGTVRALLNFCVGSAPELRAFATNGKMSDLAAAGILDRLECLPAWSARYARQRRRIAELVRDVGLEMLGGPGAATISAHVAVLAPNPVALARLPAARFDIGRYYRPLDAGFPNATKLYSRMINIPCHAGMAAISSSEIADFLVALRESSR